MQKDFRLVFIKEGWGCEGEGAIDHVTFIQKKSDLVRSMAFPGRQNYYTNHVGNLTFCITIYIQEYNKI